jgi:hypothetical protein
MSSEEKDLECTNRVMALAIKPVEILRKSQFSSKLNRLYALIENKGGLYRSDDAGEGGLINEDKKSLAKTMVLYEFTS